ncbi:hypothetical protein SH668x_002353 [Planctomicrobium sp. SH668]|uniref:hypothetical protein n=1 Tax=Planctomicrobium sp. SH668 TaxID=3448126 RepID=UPI003F5B180C
MDDLLLDDLFHGCAFTAYVELAIQCDGVPDQDTTRQLAYRYYEAELAKRNSGGSSIGSTGPSPGQHDADQSDAPKCGNRG